MVNLAPLASGILLVLTGTLIIALRKPGRDALGLFALLVLWGAATVSTAVYSTATGLGVATTGAHLTLWYALPLPFLMLATAPGALGVPPSRGVRIATTAVGIATLGALVAFAFSPGTFVNAVVRFGSGHSIESGPLLYGYTVLVSITEAGIALVAGEVARAEATGALERQRARWLAFGFGIIPIHAAGYFALFIVLGAPDANAAFFARAIPTIVAGAVALYALVRLGRALLVTGAVALALGFVDGLAGAQILTGIPIPGYERTAVVIRALFALALAVAVLRFGLGDAGEERRRHVARVVTGTLSLAAAVAVAILGFFVLGRNTLAIGVGLVLGAAVPLALRAPFANAGRRLGERLLLAPDDPRAVAERARKYAAALAASKDAGREGERFLADLRADLGISAREHELLVQGLASRDKERYQPVEVLGSGATAQVQLALDEIAGKRVVVKRFKGIRDPAAVLREARALAAVKHPRVVPFLEVDRRGDEVYLVLAYAEGGSARQLLDKEGPLPPARAVALTLDLLEGLEALHRQGMVHCDVKPENLLIDREGRGLLGDFGSARFSTPDLADATLVGGAAEGSLSTISPEALRNATPAPARDVYAAGAVLYRLLTGQHYVALDAGTVFEAREHIMLDAPRLPHPKVPVGVEAVLRRSLAKKPAERYADAGAMREALAGALARAA